MNLYKRILSAVCAAVTCVAILPKTDMNVSAQVICGEMTFNIYNDEYAAVDNCIVSNVTRIEIPSDVNGIPVTTIEERAFVGCTELERVYIPPGVTTIEDLAFSNCTSLRIINIPNSVTKIGERAFESTAILDEQTGNQKYVDTWLIKNIDSSENTAVTIKEGTRGIGHSACWGLDYAESISLPSSLRIIDDFAMAWCTSIKEITIPEGVEQIGEYSLGSCLMLEKVDIPSTVRTIGNEAFYGCVSLKDITIRSSSLEYSDYIFEADSDVLWHVVYKSPYYDYVSQTGLNYCVLGDTNADKALNLYDVIGICKHFMHMETLSGESLGNADYNGDGVINLYDAVDAAMRIMM